MTVGNRQESCMPANFVTCMDFLDREPGEPSVEVAERIRRFRDSLEHLDAISGIGRNIAEEVLAETGFGPVPFRHPPIGSTS